MITITLLGGPKDGEDISIEDDVWRSGYFKAVSAPVVKWSPTAELSPISEITYEVLLYEKKRWNPGWACLAEDWNGEIKPTSACMPIYKWTFSRYSW